MNAGPPIPPEAPSTGRGASRGQAAVRLAFVHPAPLGHGGLGRLAEDALRSLVASGAQVHAFGPDTPPAVRARFGDAVEWHVAPPPVAGWVARYTWLRWNAGQLVLLKVRRLGRWAAAEVAKVQPTHVYGFAEVSLETLQWAAAHAVPTVLDNPTGDVRHFRAAGVDAARRWGGGTYRGHPSAGMAKRVAAEYALAGRIRVASTFSRSSMVANGVDAAKVHVLAYPVDVGRFAPVAEPGQANGPLRVCSVATLARAKGFPVLIEAARALGPGRVRLRLVGGTDSRASRRILERLRAGVELTAAPVEQIQDAYRDADLFVLPTLHDGYGFVVAEAMASGLPVVVTATCGAADLVEEGRTGWIVREDDVDALAAALRSAMERRAELPAMGRAARLAVQERAPGEDVGAWVLSGSAAYPVAPSARGGPAPR